MTSHETLCIPNEGPGEAQAEITAYFADRGPCARHVRFNDDLKEPENPSDTDVASVIESDVAVVVQPQDPIRKTRALISTISFPSS